MDVDRSALATKGDLQELKCDLQSLKDELPEAFRDGQTEMLKAFYSFAQSTDAKLKGTELSDIVLRQRLTAVELRLAELESGSTCHPLHNLPPSRQPTHSPLTTPHP